MTAREVMILETEGLLELIKEESTMEINNSSFCKHKRNCSCCIFRHMLCHILTIDDEVFDDEEEEDEIQETK